MNRDPARTTKARKHPAAKRQPRVARERKAAYGVTRYATLTPGERNALAAFRARLEEILPSGELVSLILYGSRARGDAHPGSDVDLLLVHRELSPEQKKSVEDLTLDVYADKPGIHVLTYSADQVAKEAEIGLPLLVNIAQDGKVIEGEQLMVNETNKPQVSRSFMSSAKDRLGAAQSLIESGHYRDSISRSYYAALDAADAALIARGFTPKSHEGSITLFGAQIAKKGWVDKDFASLFNRMNKVRKEADYNRQATFTQSDAEHWFQSAQEFVDTLENLLPKLLEEK